MPRMWLAGYARARSRSPDPRNPIGTQSTATRQQSMKTSTAYQISFANAFADLYLDKENGEVALDLRRQEVTIYLNQTQYQALVLLIQQSLEDEEFLEFLNWQRDPLQCDENLIFEICGPEHMVCMACTPSYERVKLTFDLGVAI